MQEDQIMEFELEENIDYMAADMFKFKIKVNEGDKSMKVNRRRNSSS